MMGVRSQRRPENPISLAVADPADRPPWGAALPTLYALEEAHWWTRGMFACTAAILAADGWSGRGAVLDVGCGSGGALSQLAARPRIGLDISPLALMHARQHPDLTLVRASAMALPLAPARFDLVLALDSLDQRQMDSRQALIACAGQLRPGGRLLVRVSAHPWLHSAHDELTGTAARMSARQLQALLQAAGLTVRRLTYANAVLFPLAASRRLLADTLRRPLAHDLQLPSAPLNRLLRRVLEREASWLRRGHNLPWGLSLYALAVSSQEKSGENEVRP